MKPEDVAQYLQDHPQFFNEYADLLADIHIPGLHDDKVISINERQVASLRERNRVLQDKLLELISFGEENDAIGEKIHRLTIALLSVSSMSEFFNALYFSLREDFAVPLVAMRLWNIACSDREHVEFTPASQDVHIIAESLSQPYCGNHVADEIQCWFGEGAEHLNSFSMISLNTTRTIGLLVLGSPDAERFYPEMGTLYLKRLGELVCTTIARYDLAETASSEAQDHVTNDQ
ncbi:hypothetical protein C8R34_12067 [Nitrosomonas sp. Nm84]|uniref:DUF484 family protein n=1 Tax=Nitrosomonas sp. Nm84 TaxID=200124 RepID=UPI000D7629CF|nr:DUF484 family protein [Nitrosomonas sp. Nm84]PXW85442.1 hypothetical protein C8R34_12067 [Nitrosomonas sp. Nm84]